MGRQRRKWERNELEIIQGFGDERREIESIRHFEHGDVCAV